MRKAGSTVIGKTLSVAAKINPPLEIVSDLIYNKSEGNQDLTQYKVRANTTFGTIGSTLTPRYTSSYSEGSVAPLVLCMAGVDYAELITGPFFKQFEELPSFGGDLYALPPAMLLQMKYDKKFKFDYRWVCNVMATVPVTYQQAALNFANSITYASFPDNSAAWAAYRMASIVGPLWPELVRNCPSMGTARPLIAIPGQVHLAKDVPNAALQVYRELFDRSRSKSKKDILDIIEVIAGGCQISKMTAIGATVGTQEFMDKELRGLVPYSPGSLVGARLLFTPTGVEGAIEMRDDEVEKIFEEVRRAHEIPLDDYKRAWLSGTQAVGRMGPYAEELAAVISKKMRSSWM